MEKNEQKKNEQRIFDRIIVSVFIIICACFIFMAVVIKENSRDFIAVSGMQYTPETEVIIKEIIPTEMIVNINTAPVEELMTLDGIGEVTAQKIIKYREENNGFLTVDELTKIDGIGENKLEKIRNFGVVE